MQILYVSDAFPEEYAVPTRARLDTTWDEILWAALTIGRPSTYHVFRYGPVSFHEAIFRLSLIRMALEEDWRGNLAKTPVFTALDPTEKGMVSYFLGMTFTKLFASRLLSTPWLLHLDVFAPFLNPSLLGRSRPDLVGQSLGGEWYAFESKGRSGAPSHQERLKAKRQAQRLVSIGGSPTVLHVGSFAFFREGILQFYWVDPEPEKPNPIAVPEPDQEWGYYYEYALSLARGPFDGASAEELAAADVYVDIHPKIRALLENGEFRQARNVATQLSSTLQLEQYQPDGLRVIAGESWREIRWGFSS